MAGRKVSCNCGKIFRLGPKTEQQKAEDAARKAKKLAAKRAATANPTGPQPVVASPASATPTHPLNAQPFEAQPIEAQPIEAQPIEAQPIETQPVSAQPVEALPFEALSVEKILDAIPIEEPINPQAFEEDPLLGIAPAELHSQPQGHVNASPPYVSPLATPVPHRKPVRRQKKIKRRKPREPMGGAIWTVVYAFPGALIQGLIASTLTGGGALIGRSDAVKLVAMLFGLVAFVTTMSIFVSGVVSVVELIKGQRILLPSKIAGFAGLAMIFANLAFCGIGLIGIASRGASGSDVGKLFIMFILLSAVPLAAAITGFMRNQTA